MAAIGVIVAALVGVVVSFVTANERSARLLREADTLSKLEPGSTVHRLMSERLLKSIIRYGVETDQKWDESGTTYAAWTSSAFGAAILVWSFVGTNFDVHRWAATYRAVQVLLVVFGAFTTVLFWWSVVSDARDRRKSGKVNESQSATDGDAD